MDLVVVCGCAPARCCSWWPFGPTARRPPLRPLLVRCPVLPPRRPSLTLFPGCAVPSCSASYGPREPARNSTARAAREFRSRAAGWDGAAPARFVLRLSRAHGAELMVCM
ncbi:hypothetical protein KCMC57_up63030 [Kitasatospora sp. CMC57]|uniref:Secreted protein n=1 Tax=Kitasatospora sp. CMC57 TaxID=3231513 RepID=A0AB33K542_9ACTN